VNKAPLPAQAADFPGWYGEVVRRAELAEHSLVRGAMVIKPRGYAIWEALQRALDDRIKATGHQNLYFPLLVPMSVLEQERDLVEGFAPEVAVVTHAGGGELEEPLAIRPTSEAVIWATYARWIQSYRDLPLLYNQWANIVRWELRPRLFLRTTEFLWQEGHTAHETEREAIAEALTILHDVYADVVENVMAVPVLRGRKSARERFPGAVETFTLEALMRDGKALQAATSHYLGDGFPRTYGVRYTGRSGLEEYPFGTSWGITTRLVGALIMAHGDDRGLRLPPAVAPEGVVIVPIYKEQNRTQILEATVAIERRLTSAGVRVGLDDRDARPGFKFADWELKGAPLRLDLGLRDLDGGTVTVVRRDTLASELVSTDAIERRVSELLDSIQSVLLAQAQERQKAQTFEPATLADLEELLRAAAGFATAGWCGSAECESHVKDETAATIRCLPLERGSGGGGACIVCGRPASESATWAQAY
jgi:prolyl-tRNA synthetase